MIEIAEDVQRGSGLSSGDLAGWVERLGGMDVLADDVERIDRIRELERIKAACAAAQAELTVAFVASRTAGLSTKRARDERVRRSVSAQVAVARQESPFRGGRHVGLAQVLTGEMPNVLAALRAGVISGWRNGGPTRTTNGQGLCERCNYTKEEPGWRSEVDEHGITITTPTGHTARSVPPMPPRSTPWAEDRPIEYRPLERRLVEHRPLQQLTAETPVERRLLRLLRTA